MGGPSISEWVPVGRGRVNREGEGRLIWLVYFINLYDNRAMTPAEIVLRRGKGSHM
jgi:hypothetical protein